MMMPMVYEMEDLAALLSSAVFTHMERLLKYSILILCTALFGICLFAYMYMRKEIYVAIAVLSLVIGVIEAVKTD